MRRRNNLTAKFKSEIRTHVARELLNEFFESSSVHGVQYFSKQKRRHWSERLWWAISFSISIWLCGTSIQTIWLKWRDNPVTMSFTEKQYDVSTIPFPTVSICPETKTYARKLNISAVVHSIIQKTMNFSETEVIRMEALNNICQPYLTDPTKCQQKFTDERIFDVIQDMAPSFKDVIFECMWKYEPKLCLKHFVPVFTDEGFCFAFNAFNSNEMYTEEMAPGLMIVKTNPNVSHWSLENGYENQFNDQEYPLRVYNAKHGASLVVTLRLHERDLEYFCKGSIQGFKVILHTPGHTTKENRHTFRVPLLEEAEIAIKPKLITTSYELLRYRPNRRNCFFNNERQLRFFKSYSQHNCEAECLANFTLIQCGCVKFSMPRERNTKICGVASLGCYQNAADRLFGEDVIHGLTDNLAKTFRKECNCMSACTSITYNAEIDRAKLNWEGTLKSFGIPLKQASESKVSVVRIFFRDYEVVTIQRQALYTFTDFLAVCGGLLGLFLGISVLSIVEIGYYVTLRLFWSIRQFKSTHAMQPIRRNIISHITGNTQSNRF